MAEPEVETDTEIETEFVDPDWPAGQPDDVQRRAFIIMHLGNGEIAAHIQAELWSIADEFLKTGKIPEAADSAKRKTNLKAVK